MTTMTPVAEGPDPTCPLRRTDRGTGGYRVLLADGNAAVRRLNADALRRAGWQVDAVADGIAALQRFQQAEDARAGFDIVLVDAHLPDLNGLDVCKVLHDQPGTAGPLIVLVAADPPDSDGIDAVLLKPLTAATLASRLAELKAKQPPPASTSPLDDAASQHLQGLRILITDDNEINLEVANLNLESEGAIVYLARDGQEAINYLSAQPDSIDLVLMDVQMPVMDGYAATRYIRETLKLTDLPIIALTAGAFKNEQDAALACGMNGFIAKPFRMDEVIGTLRRLGCLPPAAARAGVCVEAEAPPAVLDIAQGLKTWLNPDSYQKYLCHFAEFYADAAQQISRSVDGDQRPHAVLLAHRLKGAAGNLALPQVEARAEQLERLLDGGGNPAQALDDLQQALSCALDAIQRYISRASAAPGSPPNRC